MRFVFSDGIYGIFGENGSWFLGFCRNKSMYPLKVPNLKCYGVVNV